MRPPVLFIALITILLIPICSLAQVEMDKMWDNRSSDQEHPNIQWFKGAKFGLFIHWGLYSKLAGEWNGKRYYGSGEWIMNQAKIPVKQYEQVAQTFNPVKFDAVEWAQFAQDAGVKYMVITAKHHEGFSMFDSKFTDFDIVDASPYGKDPMKSLAKEAAKRNIRFGFYYSQFQDWHEPNGGRNSWDFKESEKNYIKYYQEKAVPQLKELMSNYGPLGIIWFDTPGGMSKEETSGFVNDLRKYQPTCLFSSRVGHGLGDYRDFGDSEMPAKVMNGAWESIYTHNDSWGYIKYDMNFKTSDEIIRLLVEVAAKGGNLMLNIGPDGEGNIPPYSFKFLKDVGKWLSKNGEGIYGTTSGLIPQQPWGFSTSKTGKQFLHILERPLNNEILIPDFPADVLKVTVLENGEPLEFRKTGNTVFIQLPVGDIYKPNTVIELDYEGELQYKPGSITVSPWFRENRLEAAMADVSGNTHIKSFTYSHYFGDWKHTTCVTGMKDTTDQVVFDLYITNPGVYKVLLTYQCGTANAMQEGKLDFNHEQFYFRTLKTADFDKHAPMQFVNQSVATTTIKTAGKYKIVLRPMKNASELFNLKSISINPAL